MSSDTLTIPEALDRLEAQHGSPRRPLPRTALDWILWENSGYLVSDERREAAFVALKKATKLRADGILALTREALRELAGLGGMLAEQRVGKLIRIAETVQEEFDGDLQAALGLPLTKARSALKKFPGIGDPGADKILLFTGTHPRPALDSNGLRSLVRLGFAEEGKSYSSTYRAGTAALAPFVERGCPWLIRAHDLLRAHGQHPCKNKGPLCDECSLDQWCPSCA